MERGSFAVRLLGVVLNYAQGQLRLALRYFKFLQAYYIVN
jgi:hypothetical protein